MSNISANVLQKIRKGKMKIDYICSNSECNNKISFDFTQEEINKGMHQLYYTCQKCKYQLRLLTDTPCQCRTCRFARGELKDETS